MKKLKFIILILIISITKVKALDMIPKNIYYYDNGLYAYLEKEENEYENLYIEYSLNNGSEDKELEKIEVEDETNKYLLLDLDDEFLGNINDLKIKARYSICDEECIYSDWSSEENVEEFDFTKLIVPEISNLNLESEEKYTIENKKEIENYFQKYLKIYNYQIEYKEEYRINDGEWQEELSEIDLNDVKVEIRSYYKVSKYTSARSNTLIYENHPEVNMCIFGSDICCNQFFGISVCIWFLVAFILIITFIILLDNRRRLIKEA